MPRPVAEAFDAEETYEPLPPPSRSYGPDVERWRPLVQRYFKPEDVDKALYIIEGESGGNARAANPASSARGLFQLMDFHGYSEDQRYDPETSVKWAADRVYKSRGNWGDWGEGVTHEGKPFGILGIKPYQGGPAPGAPSAPPPGGGMVDTAGEWAGADPETTLERRRRIQEIISRTSDTGDVPYAAGQDEVGESDASKRRRASKLLEGIGTGGRPLRDLYDTATGKLPYVDDVKDVVRDVGNEGIPGTGILGRTIANPVNWMPGVGLVNQGLNAVREVGSQIGGVGLPGAGDVMAASLPQSALDVALTVGPGNVLKGAGLLKGILKNTDEARGVLGVVGDSASQAKKADAARRMYDKLKAAGQTDEEIAAAFGPDAVRFGQSGVDVAAQQLDEARDLARVEDTQKYWKGKNVDRASTRARQLGERMSEPGDTVMDATKLKPVTRLTRAPIPEEGAKGWVGPDGKLYELAQGVTDHLGALGKGADEAAAYGEGWTRVSVITRGGKKEIVASGLSTSSVRTAVSSVLESLPLSVRKTAEVVIDTSPPGELSMANVVRTNAQEWLMKGIADAPASGLPRVPGALADEADRLDAMQFDQQGSMIGDIATAAKRLGDPASEIRRQLTGDGDGGSAVGTRTPVAPRLPGMDGEPTPKGSWWDEFTGIAGGLRTLQASGDPGHLARQAGPLGVRHPQAWTKMAEATFKGYGSEAAARATIDAQHARPIYRDYAKAAGLKLDDFGEGIGSAERTAGYEGMNKSRASATIRRAPWVSKGEQATAAGFNELVLDIFETRATPLIKATEDAIRRGVAEPAALIADRDRQLKDLAEVTNHWRGFSGSNLASLISKTQTLFSGQFTLARPQGIADLFRPSLGPMNPLKYNEWEPARKLAAETLGAFMTSQAGMMVMMGLLGEKTGKWSVNPNPLDADFGQLRIGNTRFDTLAGFGPLIKLTARLTALGTDATGETDIARDNDRVGSLLRTFIENKESPAAGFVTDLLLHNRTPDTSTEGLLSLFVPMLIMDTVEAGLKNEGGNRALAVPAAAAAGIGLGASTYQTSEDHADRIAQQTYDGRKYDELTPVERLRVVDQLPEEAQRRGKQRSNKAYEEALAKTAYKKPEEEPPGELRTERERRKERNKVTNKANAKVFRDDPELDVQRWFSESKNGGTLHSAEAINLALELDMPRRDIKVSNMARVINESPESIAAWKAEGSKVFKYVDGRAYAEKYGDQEALKVYKKKFADLDEAHQDDVVKRIKQQVSQNDPKLDALLAYFGHGGNPTDKVYILNSPAAVDEYRKLTALYGKTPAREGWRVVTEKGMR